MMLDVFTRFGRDQSGAVLVEAAVTMTVLLIFVFGSIDFLFVFYQWNAANKAVLVGARIAAVSDPVAEGLNDLTTTAVELSVPMGSPMPPFVVICDGAAAVCSCNGFCFGLKGYDRRAMEAIVYGRGSSSCFDAGSAYYAGMCDVFARIAPANVKIIYTQTGLGYAGRGGGPSPTITVQLQNLPLQFYFLSGIRPLSNINIPAVTSVAAEDLSSTSPW
jgi:hypothetical protein